ncbi:MAG: hypothetical protein LBP50_01485, partial [Tannerella sp.]|nr:hypothetical protein [Tannerella sp.]
MFHSARPALPSPSRRVAERQLNTNPPPPHNTHKYSDLETAFNFGQRRSHRGTGGYLSRFRTFALAALLFSAMATALWAQPQSQYALSPHGNPSQIVPAGDSIKFEVETVPQTNGNGQLEIVLPAGFRLLPKNLMAGTLSPDGLSGRMEVTFSAGVAATRTFYVQPLCDAGAAVDAEARRVTYRLYVNAAPVDSAVTDPITNFYDPILKIIYPEDENVTLNQTVIRVIEITQTANASHVNNLRFEAAVTDKAGITVSKIEICRDTTANNWKNVTATALDDSQAGKYMYTIRKADLASFGYPDNHLTTGEKLYIRETVTLKKCSAGAMNYKLAFGDGTDFCAYIPASEGNVSLSIPTPAYGADILNGTGGSAVGIVYPTSPTKDGTWRIRILNTSTDPAAIMKDIYLTVGIGSQYYM